MVVCNWLGLGRVVLDLFGLVRVVLRWFGFGKVKFSGLLVLFGIVIVRVVNKLVRKYVSTSQDPPAPVGPDPSTYYPSG